MASCIYHNIERHLAFFIKFEIFWNFIKNCEKKIPCDSIKLRVDRLGMPWLEHDFTTWNKPLKWVIIYDVKICIFHKITQIRTWTWKLNVKGSYKLPQLIVISLIAMRRALWENMDQVLEQLNMFNQEIIIYRIRTSCDMTHMSHGRID